MGMDRARWGLVAAAVLPVLVGTASTMAWLGRHDVMFVNDNSWRDFPTYRDFALGMIPVQGPTTSIGGHHGFLGTWPYGLVVAAAPTPEALWIASIGLYLATMLVMGAVAKQVASWPSAVASMGVFGATNIYLMPQFPSHVMFIPIASALTVLGLLRAPAHPAWVLVAVSGVTLGAGTHRTGWILLPLVLLLDRFGRRALLGGVRTWMWSVVAVYGAAEVWISTWPAGLGPPPNQGGIWAEVAQMRPWKILLQMPFFHFDGVVLPPLQIPQTATVVGFWWLAHRAHPRRAGEPLDGGRTVLAYYAVWFVGFTFYKYDMHYYMPMLAVLPAVLALGLDAAWTRSRRRGLQALAWLGLVWWVSAGTIQHFARTFVDAPGSTMSSLTDRYAVVRALDALEVTEEELYTVTTFPESDPPLGFAWLHRWLSSKVETTGTSGRCVAVVAADAPPSPGTLDQHPAGRWRVETLTASGPCPTNLAPFGPTLWWWRVSDGTFVQRQTGAWQSP